MNDDKTQNVACSPAPLFLSVDVEDVQPNDVVTFWPYDGWTNNYYVVSVTETDVEVHNGFGSGVKWFPKHECTFARVKP